MSAIQAREETLKKIKLAFEAEGILFVDGPHVGALLGVVTAVPGIVQGRRCVLIKTSPLEPAIAILPADAIKDAKKARKEGDKRWADILESAAHMAENLPPEAGS
ncbi:hypothetical protein [Roseibium sp.]|uniref:hypothetical protein n=1 Tax=Roseibium sp. TaxID=1936156 RepID=UPI0039F028CE